MNPCNFMHEKLEGGGRATLYKDIHTLVCSWEVKNVTQQLGKRFLKVFKKSDAHATFWPGKPVFT